MMYGQYGAPSRACLSLGATGPDVVVLTEKLCSSQISDGEWLCKQLGVDDFDLSVKAAVEKFQRDEMGMAKPDGIVGPITWAKLGETGASCGSSVSSFTPAPAGQPLAPEMPFYKKEWFYWTVGGVALLGAFALVLTPKKRN
jgi:peptidoglycan hydrolase-like protein with peptidoglycan-binding domain